MSFRRNFWVTAVAVAIGVVLLCNSTENTRGQVEAQEFGRLEGSSYRRVEFVPSAESSGYSDSDQPIIRVKRQVTIPQGSQLQYQQPQQPPQQQTGGGIMSYLTELGPQLAQARALTSLLSPQTQPQQQQPSIFGVGGVGSGSPTSSVNPVQLMSQLSDLIRATQARTARGIESGQATSQSAVQSVGQQAQDVAKSAQTGFQSSVQTVGQQTADAAKSAQSGIQSALSEIGAGLQRIATNNPNLVPDVKNLYQSVSSKLSSASTSVGQVANQNSNPIPIPS